MQAPAGKQPRRVERAGQGTIGTLSAHGGFWEKDLNQMRPSWDEYFMAIAEVVASRSVCLRHKIGAVIVNEDRQILSTGYNGPPRGIKHCAAKGGCIRDQDNIPSGTRQEYCFGLHAEQNAIVQAAREGIRLLGSTLYCTYKPCSLCARMIVNAGIKKVYFMADYPDDLTLRILKEGEISYVKWDAPVAEPSM